MTGPPTVLTVHAADPAGDEGILEDALTLRDLGCRPVQVTTALLLPRRKRSALEGLPAALVAAQFAEAVSSVPPAAARTGILADAAQIETVAALLRSSATSVVVCAPVARAGRSRVLDGDGVAAIRRHLFPLARVVVVRVGDLEAFSAGRASDVAGLARAAAEIRSQGARAVLVTGGGWNGRVVDVLDDEGRISVFDTTRVVAPRVAGVAGAHPAALAAFLAKGEALARSADAAQRHVGLRFDRT